MTKTAQRLRQMNDNPPLSEAKPLPYIAPLDDLPTLPASMTTPAPTLDDELARLRWMRENLRTFAFDFDRVLRERDDLRQMVRTLRDEAADALRCLRVWCPILPLDTCGDIEQGMTITIDKLERALEGVPSYRDERDDLKVLVRDLRAELAETLRERDRAKGDVDILAEDVLRLQRQRMELTAEREALKAALERARR